MSMLRRNESYAELLLKAPWWVSAVLGVFVFIVMLLAPVIWPAHETVTQAFTKEISRIAPLPLIFFGMVAGGSFWFCRKRRLLVEQQICLQPLQQTTWKEFEFLVAEMFRRRGYEVNAMSAVNARSAKAVGADGRVDLVLRKDGRTSLVQCKQWKYFPVGAPVIREMFGLMRAENADEAIIVTTGRFTGEAQRFAGGKPIRLIDGRQISAMSAVSAKAVGEDRRLKMEDGGRAALLRRPN